MNNSFRESEILIYETEEEKVNVEVVLKDENIWLNQKRMAELFDVTTDDIGLHLKNIYNEEELEKESTTEEFSVVQKEC